MTIIPTEAVPPLKKVAPKFKEISQRRIT